MLTEYLLDLAELEDLSELDHSRWEKYSRRRLEKLRLGGGAGGAAGESSGGGGGGAGTAGGATAGGSGGGGGGGAAS